MSRIAAPPHGSTPAIGCKLGPGERSDEVDTEFWLHGFPVPRSTAGLAAEAERRGFDGLLLADSENLVGDPYVELALAAHATTRLRLDRVSPIPSPDIRP
jgi:hypothetical protein